jgi:hypothetical protein
MVVFNYSGREINAKIVYYGPGLSGKTTNLENIHSRTAPHLRGKMVSMKTKVDRTLFFDFLPIEGGEIAGFNIRFLLYTVPGQVYYNATRKLVLKGADAIVFVADSQGEEMAANRESLKNLEDNLREYDKGLGDIPWVIQYNKRDLPSAMPVEKLEEELNPQHVPYFESVATDGTGVFETLSAATNMVMKQLRKQLVNGDEPDLDGQDESLGSASESAQAQAKTGQTETDSSTIKVSDVPSPGEEPSSVPAGASGSCPPAPPTQTATVEPGGAEELQVEPTAIVPPAAKRHSDLGAQPASTMTGVDAQPSKGLDDARGKHLRIPIKVSNNGKPGHVIVNLAVDVEVLVDEDDHTV